MKKINVLYCGEKNKFNSLKAFFPLEKYSLSFISDIATIEAYIIDKNPRIVILSIDRGRRLNEIPSQVLEKQRHMSYYFLIAILDEGTEYMKELILKSGFDDVLLEPVGEEISLYFNKLITAPKREIRAILVQGWAMENHDKSFFFAKSRDLSRSGMLFETNKELSLGQEVRISFVMPILKENISITGKIVRRLTPAHQGELTRYGLNFIDIPSYSRKVLDQFFPEEQIDERKPDNDRMS